MYTVHCAGCKVYLLMPDIPHLSLSAGLHIWRSILQLMQLHAGLQHHTSIGSCRQQQNSRLCDLTVYEEALCTCSYCMKAEVLVLQLCMVGTNLIPHWIHSTGKMHVSSSNPHTCNLRGSQGSEGFITRLCQVVFEYGQRIVPGRYCHDPKLWGVQGTHSSRLEFLQLGQQQLLMLHQLVEISVLPVRPVSRDLALA